MASIRDSLLRSLVARLAGNAGWDAQVRARTNSWDPAKKISAVAYVEFEQKRLENNLLYGAQMQVTVRVRGRDEDADDSLDGSNPYRYLDRLVAVVEAAPHVPADWADPGFTDVEVTGHEVLPPGEQNTVSAEVHVSFRYRHNVDDPGAYSPHFP